MNSDNSCIVSLDLGTTHIKSFAYSIFGEQLAADHADTPSNKEGHQEAESVKQVSFQVLSTVLKELKVKGIHACAISISGAMHSILPVDKDINALYYALLWNDNSGVAIAENLRKSHLAELIFHETGTPIHPMSPLIKLAWLRQSSHEIFNQAASFISIKEYVYYHLTGCRKTDFSIASATGLFDSANLKWSSRAMEFTQINPDQLFEPVSPYHIENLLPELCKTWELSPSFPVVIGASDGCLATLGAASLKTGNISMSMGTSAALRSVIPLFKTEKNGRLFTYLLDESHFIIGGPSNNAGAVFSWFASLFSNGPPKPIDFEHLISQAALIEPGSAGLTFQPWLYGERAPYWNASLTAGFRNLRHTHTASHMGLAVLEGIIFNLNTILKLLQETVDVSACRNEIQAVYVGGGLAKFPFLQQLLADIFNLDIYYNGDKEDSSAGAAIIGFKAMELLQDIENQHIFYNIKTMIKPDPSRSEVYSSLYQKFIAGNP